MKKLLLPSRILFLIQLVFILCITGFSARAQQFKLMRYDEDYTYLKDSARSFYNRLKYTPISADKQVYFSFGGEARVEYADFTNEDWGKENINRNNFLLQRYDAHADLHMGTRLRIFAQLRSALQSGRKNGPRPIDKDELNIQNLFVDLVPFKKNGKSITLRAGRQELNYGSGRLISVREGPNARLYFTGAKLMYSSRRFFIDAFAMMADTVNPGVFDNKPTKQVNLWGTYATWILPKAGNFDFYYLGFYRNGAAFDEGKANETRHTGGLRLWKNGGGFIYNLEAAYQFGEFGKGKIKAWTGSIDLGYSFEKTKLKPGVNLRNDYISGDTRKGDGQLQTFNPLYPKGGYFGFNPQIGPVNLIDIHPYITLEPGSKTTLQADVVFNWRYSLQDGIYRPSGNFNLSSSSSAKRYIGTAYLLSADYRVNNFIKLNLGVQYFITGSFINNVIPEHKNGLFINARAGFKI